MVDRIGSRTLWTFVVTSIALVMVTLDNLVVTTALPVIRTDLNAGVEGLEWTINAYTLTFAVFLLTGAALGDRFGRRRMFVIGLGIFTAASALAALAPTIEVLERRSRAAGHRRRDRRPVDADDPQRGCAGGETGARARRVGRHRRPGGRARSRRRRCRRPGNLLALDLLDQRPDRPRVDAARMAAPRRDPSSFGEARPPRPRPRQRRAARDRLGSRARQRAGVGEPGDRALARPSAPRSSLRSFSGSSARRRRCCPCGSSRTGRSARRTLRRSSCSSGCSARSSCSRSSSRPCRATRRFRRVCESFRGRRCRSSSRRSPGAMSDRIGGQRIMGVGLTLQAIGLGWIAAVSTPTTPYSELDRPLHPLRHGHGALLRAGGERRPQQRATRGGGQGGRSEQRDPRARRGVRRRGARLALCPVRRLRDTGTRSSTDWCPPCGWAQPSSASARSPRSPFPRDAGDRSPPARIRSSTKGDPPRIGARSGYALASILAA